MAPEELLRICLGFLQKAHGLDLPYSLRDGIQAVRFAQKLHHFQELEWELPINKASCQVVGEEALNLEAYATKRRQQGFQMPNMDVGDFFFDPDIRCTRIRSESEELETSSESSEITEQNLGINQIRTVARGTHLGQTGSEVNSGRLVKVINQIDAAHDVVINAILLIISDSFRGRIHPGPAPAYVVKLVGNLGNHHHVFAGLKQQGENRYRAETRSGKAVVIAVWPSDVFVNEIRADSKRKRWKDCRVR